MLSVSVRFKVASPSFTPACVLNRCCAWQIRPQDSADVIAADVAAFSAGSD
jgi:hypothetical protein